MTDPVIVINFKAYREAEGPRALEIAKICQKVSDESGVAMAVCPPVSELGYVARSVSIPVFAQNADPRVPGSSTGWITPSMIKSSGACGTLINHSEHRMPMQDIGKTVELCWDIGLKTMVCSDTVSRSEELAAFRPDCIAVEPPELIGGDVSVTTAAPDIIEKTVDAVRYVSKAISIFCGAGIKTGDDVKKALDLGADGVLLASGVIKAKDPRSALLNLIRSL